MFLNSSFEVFENSDDFNFSVFFNGTWRCTGRVFVMNVLNIIFGGYCSVWDIMQKIKLM